MPVTDSVVWIGRVRQPSESREHVVRVITDGDSPGPDDVVEEIDDPFASADPRYGGSAHAGQHASVLARELPALAGGVSGPLNHLALAPPVRAPKIVCVGRNYAAHAREFGNEPPPEPLLFFKPSSALLPSGDPIRLPSGYERIDMEAELVVVIGAVGTAVGVQEAANLVAGYTLGNDVSNRDLQRGDKTWLRGKGFDTFAPCGPFVRIVEPGVLPPGEARIRGWYGDQVTQDAPLSDMIFDIPTVLSFVSRFMTLHPGDLVYSGTPAGVPTLSPGGITRVECDGFSLGRLTNPVTA